MPLIPRSGATPVAEPTGLAQHGTHPHPIREAGGPDGDAEPDRELVYAGNDAVWNDESVADDEVGYDETEERGPMAQFHGVSSRRPSGGLGSTMAGPRLVMGSTRW